MKLAAPRRRRPGLAAGGRLRLAVAGEQHRATDPASPTTLDIYIYTLDIYIYIYIYIYVYTYRCILITSAISICCIIIVIIRPALGLGFLDPRRRARAIPQPVRSVLRARRRRSFWCRQEIPSTTMAAGPAMRWLAVGLAVLAGWKASLSLSLCISVYIYIYTHIYVLHMYIYIYI